MKYIYPAIFTPEPDGISVDFPDLPGCYTDGATVEEAFENAEDALSLMLWLLEKEKQTPPTPTPPTALRAAHGASIALVKADTLPVRKLNDSRTVRKTLPCPAGWTPWPRNTISISPSSSKTPSARNVASKGEMACRQRITPLKTKGKRHDD